jgi:hypothetical protein
MNKTLRSLLAAAMLAATVASAQPAAAAESSSAGTPKFVLRMGPEFNHFVEGPTPSFVSWMNQNFWRTEVFSPYFDNKTSWYPHGWVYRDLYAIYPTSHEAAEHPEWILRGANGEPMYIPWGCANGTCPQYAADVADPSFRHAWIAEAKAEVEKGYAGIWLDDVNLEFRVGNGNGEQTAPIDPNTGRAMSETAWREYVDTFLEEIRQALPQTELLENSIWFAGGGERWKNPLVQRQIATANYINLERGVNDGGLTGGDGAWSLKTFLSFVDSVHAAGKGVIFDGASNTAVGREYSLAAYFLTSTGNDGIGNGAMTPENWWGAYNENLGAPEGPRSEWDGLLRRDYSDGVALLNEPEAPTRTVTLPAPMYTTEGTIVTSVTLGASSGAVLRYVEPPSSKGGQEGTGKGSGGEGSPVTVGLSERAGKHAQEAAFDGRVSAASSGSIRLNVQRLVNGHWVQSDALTTPLGHAGGFATKLRHLASGHYRAQATMTTAGAGTASSATVSFAIPTSRTSAAEARFARRDAKRARRYSKRARRAQRVPARLQTH